MLASLIHCIVLGADPGMTYQQYLAFAREAFVNTPQYRQILRSTAVQQTQQEAALLQAPVTLGANAGVTGYQPTPVIDGMSVARQALGITTEATLTYRDRSTFEGVVTARAGWGLQQQPSLVGASSLPLSVDLRVSYDLIQGGADSAEWLVARGSNRRSSQRETQLQQEVLESLLTLLELSTQAAAAQCRLALLSEVEARIVETVKTGELELRTRTLSQKDFFNFTTLETNFRSQQAGQRSALVTALRALEAFGDSGRAVAGAVQRVRCTVSAPTLPADWGAPQVVEVVARGQPAVRALDAFRESLTLDVAAARLVNRPGVRPFLSGTFAKPDFSSQALGQVTAGLAFQWNVPQRRGQLNVHATEESAASAGELTARVYQETRSQLLRSAEQIRAQAGVVNALLTAEANANKLLAVLAAQRAIGQVDSLNFTSAYLSKIQASQSALDAWATMHNAFNDLRERALAANAPLPEAWARPFAPTP